MISNGLIHCGSIGENRVLRIVLCIIRVSCSIAATLVAECNIYGPRFYTIPLNFTNTVLVCSNERRELVSAIGIDRRSVGQNMASWNIREQGIR
jgi:hypothetical protein